MGIKNLAYLILQKQEEGFDIQFPEFTKAFVESFKVGIQQFTSQKADRKFAKEFIQTTQSNIAWIKNKRNEQLQ